MSQPARSGPMGRGTLEAQLPRLRDLVRGEQRQRLLACFGDLIAQGGLARSVAGDALILADGQHERSDPVSEALAQVGRADGGLLDHVMKRPGGDQVIRGARGGEERRNLTGVANERSAVDFPDLAGVRFSREPEGGPRYRKSRLTGNPLRHPHAWQNYSFSGK